MSGSNTKSSKLNRVLSRQLTINDDVANTYRILAEQHETDRTTIKLLTETVERNASTMKIQEAVIQSLLARVERMTKYLGSVLFARRQKDAQIPTLEPAWGNHTHKTAEGA